ncbi:MAG: hypothetical protein ACOYBR_09695 [Fluviibacter sp.]
MRATLDEMLAQPHVGNCATYARHVLACMFGKRLELEQFALPMAALADADAIVRRIARDAATRVAVPLAGDVALMRRVDGRAHVGVIVTVDPVSILHLADTSGRAHCTKIGNLRRFGLTLDGFYRVIP